MRLFWSIILIFAAVAGVLAWMHVSSKNAPVDAGRTLVAANQPSVPTASPDSNPVESVYHNAPSSPITSAEDNGVRRLDPEQVAARELVDDLLSGRDEPSEMNATAHSPKPRTPGDADREPPKAMTSASGTVIVGGNGGGNMGGDHEHNTQPQERAENPWAGSGAAERTALKHSIETQADGSTLLDGIFTLRGDGSADRPYEITWDLLMSAAETYQPRLGMDDLPERIAMLDGKHVRISGYLMFPTAALQATELLVMLNQWDGCCLGTMPSPYDAIEVQLGTPVSSANRQYMNYGTLEGKLVVDPYLINDWLIGLYLLEDATLKMGL